MIKILLVNESFANQFSYRRWELFAEKHKDIDVTLLAPREEKVKKTKGSFGREFVIKANELKKDNFRIKLYTKKNIPYFGYVSKDFKQVLLEIQPDIVYNIGVHTQLSLMQLIYLTKHYLPKSKVMAFSMRGPQFDISHYKDYVKPLHHYLIRLCLYPIAKLRLMYLNKNCDAIFCHYPSAVESFRKEGYKGPIYMQTQVGVNPEVFFEDNDARNRIRKKYSIADDTYLFGSATRFTPDKGLYEIIEALPLEGNWKYLMMGAGLPDELEKIKQAIKKRGLDNKIILTGFIKTLDISEYYNAIDCMIHFPKTTFGWEETFSIALVQNMMIGNPIIGSDSGSVPYQIGPDGIIVPECDVKALHDKIQWVLSHQNEVNQIGAKMKKRAEECFSIFHLNGLFYDTITEDVFLGKYDRNKMDMANYPYKVQEK